MTKKERKRVKEEIRHVERFESQCQYAAGQVAALKWVLRMAKRKKR